MGKKLLSTSGLITAAILLLTINLFAGLVFKSSRLDLTDNQLYTLSDGTQNVLSKLDEQVTLRYYFSEKFFTGVPGIANYGQRVRDLLEEYVAIAGGNLKIIVADPEPFSDVEDQAVQYGLQGVPVDNSGNQAYFGLVGTNSTDDEEIIAFFQPEKEHSLEYDITRMVYKLANPKSNVVGLLSSLPMDGGVMPPMMPGMPPQSSGEWFIVNQIKQSFELKNLELDIENIPSDIDVLMVVHPKSLSEPTLKAIDQFVLNGGRLLAFVDPFSEVDAPPQNPQNPMAAMQAPRNSNMEKLFKAWGVELVDGKIAVDRLNAQRVQTQMGQRVQALDYVAWLSLDQDEFNSDDFISQNLEKVGMATPGHFKIIDGTEMSITPLIETSAEATEIDSMQFQFGANPASLLRNYKAGSEKLMLAARINGKIKSAFPDENSSEELLKESKESVNIIVVADTDMLDDKHWVRIQNFFGNQIALPLANNDAFVLNAIENLSGSNDLISLRSRSQSTRPFDRVLELKRDAEKRFQDKEKELQNKLQETERKLAELQQKRDGNSNLILSDDQKQAIAKFREEQVQVRKELRNVQHELVKSIENLGTALKVINITAMPLLVIIFALILGNVRSRRLKQVEA